MDKIYLRIKGGKIELPEEDTLVIGRTGYGATVEISDNSASRKHGLIERRGEDIFIKDTNSLNGIYLNEKKINPDEWVKIVATDRIKIVATEITITKGIIEERNIQPGSENEIDEEIKPGNLKQRIKHKGIFQIGRSKTNDIVMEDPTVSRSHAKISFENDKYWIEDLGSKNKTYLNNKELKNKTELKDGDIVSISFYRFNLIEGLKDLRKQRHAIKAVAIQKKYPNNKIGLQPISLNIPTATFAALMGPSGCGKSTLLKCLNGDNPATSGDVLIHGLSLKENFNLIKKKIGYVPQDDIIHRELTVYKTLYYAAKLRLPDDTSDEEINKRINRVIKSLNLDQDEHKDVRGIKVGSLSGGQRKRISIAVELLTEPTILFLDEPTSPLDPETIENFLKSLQNLTEEGTTIIMVTHKPEDLNYVDQVIFLGIQGYLTYKGPAKALTSHFDTNTIVEVYGKMSNKEHVLKEYEKQKPSGNSIQVENVSEVKRDKPDSLILQLYWLIARYLKIKLTDRENLVLLLAQPVIIAGLVSFIFNELSIGVLFMMAISAIWFGVSNAAKEIVGELSVYRRERMFNLNLHTYILSKWTVLSLIALVQTVIFISIVYLNFSINTAEGYPETYLRSFWGNIAFMFYIAISATFLGLLLSAYFNTTEKVMTVVPIALMPQIMLAGVMTKIDNTLVELLSFTTLGRWGTEGFSRIQDQSFTDEEAVQSVLYAMPSEASSETLVASGAIDRLGLYQQTLIDDGTLIGSVFNGFNANLLVIAILNILVYVLIFIALKRKDKI